MESKICSMCFTEKLIEDFYNSYTELINCNSIGNLKRHYENKDKISIERRIFYEKMKKKHKLLQKQNDRHIYILKK